MARKLPPFASVRAFEAAARHCSFKAAGSELSLTPSAISHQVKSLEDYFGFLLFYRNRNNLSLTEAGDQYLQELTAVLDDLETATDRLKLAQDQTSLTIHLFPSLASNWFLSKIPPLRALHPEIEVNIVTSRDQPDFKSSEIDFAITYLKKDSPESVPKPGFRSEFLFDEYMVPVCSDRLSGSDDMLINSLIQCQTDPEEWSQWCLAAGIPFEEPKHRIKVDNRALAIKAAVDGLGIAMGRTPFHNEYVSSGQLITPFQHTVSTGYGYYLVCSERKWQSQNLRKFSRWLLTITSEFLR